MNRDLIIDLVTALFVFGSAFGIPPLKRALHAAKWALAGERRPGKMLCDCTHT